MVSSNLPTPRIARSRWVAIAATMFIGVLGSTTVRGEDDWHVVERHSNDAPAAQTRAPSASGEYTTACGEAARPAEEPFKSIVAQLNDMWGTSFPVFQSTKAMSPHAHMGGCIFYNSEFLHSLVQQWMNIKDEDAVTTMLYAIFAHEIGHLAHGDFDESADNVPIKNKELAADQFAGYSVQRLGRRRLDAQEVTQYYQLTGDDFVGHTSGHGNGSERTMAFQDGWHRAEIGLPEQGARSSGGLGEP